MPAGDHSVSLSHQLPDGSGMSLAASLMEAQEKLWAGVCRRRVVIPEQEGCFLLQTSASEENQKPTKRDKTKPHPIPNTHAAQLSACLEYLPQRKYIFI